MFFFWCFIWSKGDERNISETGWRGWVGWRVGRMGGLEGWRVAESCTLFLPPFPMLREPFLWSFVIAPFHSNNICQHLRFIFHRLFAFHSFSSLTPFALKYVSWFRSLFQIEYLPTLIAWHKNSFCLLFSSIQIPSVRTAVVREWTNYFISLTKT